MAGIEEFSSEGTLDVCMCVALRRLSCLLV